MKRRVMVIAPHPDDEILGCGGVMARFAAEGDEIFVCVVSNHDAPVFTPAHRETTKSEARAAHALIGVKETIFLDFPALTLKDLPVYTLNGAIARAVTDVKPDTVFLPHSGDVHIDHQLVAQSSLVAIRPMAHCSVSAAYSYETLSETEWNLPRAESAFMPNYYVDISAHLQKKLDAMACFSSQLYAAPHPRSLEALTHLAGYRGSTISVPFAESFMVIRMLDR